MKKKKPAKRLGLKRMKLTTENCFERAEELRQLSKLAKTWANWYQNKGKKLSQCQLTKHGVSE